MTDSPRAAYRRKRDFAAVATPARKQAAPAAARSAGAVTANEGEGVRVAGVTITHAGRPIPDGDGATKLDVVRYHEAVAAWLLPQIRTRPLALVKCPGGDFGHCFFQKHSARAHRPVPRPPDDPPYLRLPDLKAVVAAVQGGAVEFHSWGASFPRIDLPDRMTLDLDPDPAVTWDAFRDAATEVRDLLTRIELAWFLKTTGGKGLHFVVPLVRRYGWDDVKALAAAIARHLARAHPALFVATASKAQRDGKVFVDYLRNAEGATAVAAYSLRARPGLPVSMPIEWEALRTDVRGAHFNLHNVPGILAARTRDPWAAYEASRQRLRASLAKVLDA